MKKKKDKFLHKIFIFVNSQKKDLYDSNYNEPFY